ncbi:hypothetical protein COV12_03190 [Candidatus Woesearchaeota archaeon CG10_big_fil_rev_8_21_14_0_10_32_24]|nr:MAG: hypothetical protein COV12_03190 [Candidatus Woesearchaeota archaeon CG10_big_fil_rev_8_21_14_0_10_32_24]
MCNLKDAKRWIKLAEMQVKENNVEKARESYLEAASIYVLQLEFTKDNHLLKHANECYMKSKEVIGKKWEKVLTKQELAQRTLIELNEDKITIEDLRMEIENV